MRFSSLVRDAFFYDNFTIREVGINLKAEEYQEIKRKLQNLELRTPSSAKIKFIITRVGKEVEGKLIVKNKSVNFSATTHYENAIELYNKLENEIDEQLLNWKRNRFIKNNDIDLVLKKQEYAV